MYQSDTILLQRFASAGDAEAFSEIVNRYANLVYSASLRVLADKDTAADATQETFFQLLQNASSVTGSLSGWLHRVATRKAVDVIRRDSSRRKRQAQYAEDKTVKAEKWQDISPVIDEAMDQLEDQTRRILIEHFFNGKTMTELAAAHDISQPTVSRKIESGIEKLRDKLKHRGVITVVTTLTALLAQNTVEAAPATVLTELGKMALAGATSTAATAVMTAAKIKIITAAAVAITTVGAIVTYIHVKNQDETSQPIAQKQQTANPPAASRPATVSPNTKPDDNITDEQFEEWLLTEILDTPETDKTDSTDIPQAQPIPGGAVGFVRPATKENEPTETGNIKTEIFTPDFSTPEMTVTSLVTVFSTGDMAQIAECFVEGADDVENLRRTIEDPQDAEDVQMKTLLQSIGLPIEIVKTFEERNGLGVIWLSTVQAEFTLGNMTFAPGDKFELDANLVLIGKEWKITGM